jgi:hypothetical protein
MSTIIMLRKQHVEKNKDNDPVVAITFYSKRTPNTAKGYYEGIFNDANVKDVLELQHGLAIVAKKKGRIPPTIEITLFLIPNWESENLDSDSYKKAKEQNTN